MMVIGQSKDVQDWFWIASCTNMVNLRESICCINSVSVNITDRSVEDSL